MVPTAAYEELPAHTGWTWALVPLVSFDTAGGELDPSGATGKGNPIGGLVFGNHTYGHPVQFSHWTGEFDFCPFLLVWMERTVPWKEVVLLRRTLAIRVGCRM